jgi:hypothetical protein
MLQMGTGSHRQKRGRGNRKIFPEHQTEPAWSNVGFREKCQALAIELIHQRPFRLEIRAATA